MRKDILNSITQMKEVKNLINKSEIARRFNCSINTVNKYLNIQESHKSKRKYSSKLEDIVNKLMIDINNENINFAEKPIRRLKEEQKYLSSLPSIDCISQYFRQNKGYKVSKESMITLKNINIMNICINYRGASASAYAPENKCWL